MLNRGLDLHNSTKLCTQLAQTKIKRVLICDWKSRNECKTSTELNKKGKTNRA